MDCLQAVGEMIPLAAVLLLDVTALSEVAVLK